MLSGGVYRLNRVLKRAIADGGDGTIEVTVSAHYPLEDAARAHRDLLSRKTIGSVVLIP